ncbi:MAG: M60 family metallopeptidase [Bacteroidales bacterium]|nr:M60 family metallopeptidase [Bacteroidales bacterium]
MKQIHKIFLLALAMTAPLAMPTGLHAQNLQLTADDQKGEYILTAVDTVDISYSADFTSVAVASNCTYTATTDADWLTLVQEADGSLTLFNGYYYGTSARYGTVTLTSTSGDFTRTLVVEQEANNSAAELEGDKQLEITTATASSSQSGTGIALSYDGDVSTIYHSSWGGSTMPITLTYTLADFPHVDYVVYTPRQSGTNGNFGEVTIEYTVQGAASTWIKLGDYDFGGSSSASTVSFGDEGVDNVYRVRFSVNSASSDGDKNYASCAEMTFYQKNTELAEQMKLYFEDDLCTTLKSGVTEADLGNITNGFVRQLVYQMLQGDYSTDYRVGEFEPYRTLSSLRSELKTSNNYNSYENPTGIYFTSGQTLALLVEGIPDGTSVSLIIKSFGETQDDESGHPQSTYGLSNGVNVITTQNRGNGYISYYSDDFETLPNVRIHFVNATVNGYFDLQRGDDNTYWKELLANATSDILDVRSQRLQVACPVDLLKSYCPNNGVELATIYDSLVYREREIMGLSLYGREPKNRQFARPVDSGMYADGYGAAAAFSSFGEWVNYSSFGYWGLGHELGHNNQVTPGFKWVGCGETTNNVYAAWVEHKLGSGYHRLEDESSGIDSYSGLRGGRFQSYIEETIRKGSTWLLSEGPDNYNSTPDTVSVAAVDYDGIATGETVTATTRGYDSFVALAPLWQLELYCIEAGHAPDVFGKFLEGVRTYDEDGMTGGQLQMKFVRSFCDSAQIDFTAFFERAGILKPVTAYITDYSTVWHMISEDMVNEVKEYIAAKNYPEPDEALYFINANNWEVYRDEAALVQATVGEGCTALSSGRIQVDGNVWQNAVGYETYDADGNLLYMTSFGLGAAQSTSRYTQVLWDDDSAYIMAVGYDGTRYKCYEP